MQRWDGLRMAGKYLLGDRRGRMRLLEFAVLAAALFGIRTLAIMVWQLPNGDVYEYYRYALAFWTTNPPFHHFPVEYPPLAILSFTLTLLPPLADYQAVYAYWMGALFLAGYAGFLRVAGRRRALTYALYLLVGTSATLLARFDLVPALVTLAALWAAQRRRFGEAYVLIALGILLKLYPVFLLPIVAIEHWHVARAGAGVGGAPDLWLDPRTWWRGGPRAARRRLGAWWSEHPGAGRVARGVGLCAGVVVLGFLGPLVLNPGGALSGFSYAGNRPLQIESTPATLLWLGTIFGIPAHPDYSFVSLNEVGVLDAVLKPLSALALIGGCLIVYWRQTRGRLAVGQAFVACLCVVIVTNKVFSPQYLIWVLPFVAAVEGFDFLWLVVCALTTYDYPILYQRTHHIELVPFNPQFMPVLAIRNGLLIVLTIRAIFPAIFPVRRPAAVGDMLPEEGAAHRVAVSPSRGVE